MSLSLALVRCLLQVIILGPKAKEIYNGNLNLRALALSKVEWHIQRKLLQSTRTEKECKCWHLACFHAVAQPSKHLWLGNIPMRPDKAAIEYLFGSFGHVTSVRVFPGKTFAFVNFETAQEAEYAMKCLDGLHWPAVSGRLSWQKPPRDPSLKLRLTHLHLMQKMASMAETDCTFSAAILFLLQIRYISLKDHLIFVKA